MYFTLQSSASARLRGRRGNDLHACGGNGLHGRGGGAIDRGERAESAGSARLTNSKKTLLPPMALPPRTSSRLRLARASSASSLTRPSRWRSVRRGSSGSSRSLIPIPASAVRARPSASRMGGIIAPPPVSVSALIGPRTNSSSKWPRARVTRPANPARAAASFSASSAPPRVTGAPPGRASVTVSPR